MSMSVSRGKAEVKICFVVTKNCRFSICFLCFLFEILHLNSFLLQPFNVSKSDLKFVPSI